MDMITAMKERHSVRSYKNEPIADELLAVLQDEIDDCNKEGNLHIQLITNEPKAFDSFMAHYGKFSGVTNYIALIGKKSPDLEEKCGYYGERLVLKAQSLGLNSCWVAMTYKKIPGTFTLDAGEKLTVVIAIGYGKTTGVAHKSKAISAVSNVTANSPEWFKNGVEAALLAPTAMNQQKFTLTLNQNEVTAKAGMGFYAKTDLGIVKYHFEIGANSSEWHWSK
ncbi:nitroreductase family protein [Frisingicoccus sp.]|uniref:nitroreductase family protein n=1 Tax=Frisingicoccus sp. TaxID=1918627 RepID=UPI002EBEE2CF|nr:nitroreductase family protein [Frisingicoccus sp.]